MPGLGPQGAGEGGDADFTLQCLLQELLMALVGYTGDVFVDGAAADGPEDELQHPDRCTVALAADIPWAGSEDREQLNDLARLGFHFKQLQRFVEQERAPAEGRSLYRQALSAGLTEVLAVYEDEVVELQEQLLQGGAERGLPGLCYQLADMQMLLPQLHRLAYDLRRRRRPAAVLRGGAGGGGGGGGEPQAQDDVATAAAAAAPLEAPPEARGARLLATLHGHRLNGQPLLQACMSRLLWHANQVLFNQLTMWMVHGLLADEGGEFFIRPRELHEAPPAGGQQHLGADDTQPALDTARASGGGSSWGGGAEQQLAQRGEDEAYRDWHEAFEVALNELPPGISPHLATSVEFVGRAVRLLRNAPASAKLRQLQESCLGPPHQAAAQLQLQQQQPWGPWGSGGGGGTEQAAVAVLQHLLPHEDTLAFATSLRGLQQQPAFSQAALERTVEAIRADVASRLWQLLVVQAGLLEHLGAVKDYALLARGDFYNCFLADASRLLAVPPREKTATADIAVPWQSAALKSTAQDDPHFALFRLALRPKGAAAAAAAATAGRSSGGGAGTAPGRGLVVPSYDGAWDELVLEARLPWPLGVLLTPRHMERYNAMFQLLLRLKRVQLALEQAWQELGRLCGRRGGGTCASDITPLLQLRQHMGHLIGNLQIYLQLDVVESNYARLQDKVAAAQDFAEAEHAHERFLHALVTQSFLSHTSLVRQLGEVFGQTSALCRLVKGARERGIDWAQVKEVHAAFDRTMSSLYVNLQSKTLQQYDKAPYLRQLYLRLDFNGYIRQQHMRILQVHKAVPSGYRQQLQAAARDGAAGGGQQQQQQHAREGWQQGRPAVAQG